MASVTMELCFHSTLCMRYTTPKSKALAARGVWGERGRIALVDVTHSKSLIVMLYLYHPKI